MLEAVVAPVLAHLAVDEVLVDRGELRGEHVVEDVDDFAVALHGRKRITTALLATARQQVRQASESPPAHSAIIVAQSLLASAAVAADAAVLERVDALGASLNGGPNVTVGSSSANADDHVPVLSIQLRLSLNLRT